MHDAIGIIDRGVGGLGLYKKLRQESTRPILYFADNGNIPYGLVEKTTLKTRLTHIINTLKQHGANKIVLACNSASVVYPDSDDIKGIIQFGVSSLIKAKAKKPALIATLGTVNSGAYATHFKNLDIAVTERVAQPFAIHIENGIVEGDLIEQDAQDIMQPLQHCDAILMACTHFPAITPLLQRHINPQCQLIDPIDDMHTWIQNNWPETTLNKSSSQFFVTGSASQFIQSAKISFNVGIDLNEVTSLAYEFPTTQN